MRLLYKKSKRILYIFLALTIVLCPLFHSQTVHAEKSGKNAYLAVYFDEATCSYKYRAVVSGKMLEYSHVASLLPEGKLKSNEKSSKWYVHGLQMAVKESDKRECVSNVKVQDSGYISIAAKQGDKAISDYDKIDSITEKDCLPLTFPALGCTYTERDLQRCNDVINTLCSDFNSALLYINDGNTYIDQDYFHQMVIALISTQSGGILTNGYGHKYKIEWSESNDEMHGYAKLCTITGVSDSYKSGSQTFVYKIKKGYIGSDAYGETMENGQKNKVYIVDDDLRKSVCDTYWITWEHLYLEGEMLYAEGITYGTKNDLYEESSLLNTVQKGLNNFKSSFIGDLSIHSALELVYNDGVYGSNAYVFGIYKQSTNDIVFTIYLAFAAIMVSLLSVSIIKLINEHQTLATYNSMNRASILKDVKSMIMCLFSIAFSWQIFKLLFMINFYFVKIWAAFLYENYSFVYYNGTVAANGLIEIAMVIVWIYIDVLYIMRSIFVPILMAASPIFIYLYTLGGNFQRITVAWFKELLGTVFMQSIHAFVLTFVLMIAQDTSGITQVVVWACVIPLTKMFRDMCGLGGKELFAAAKGLSAGAVTGAGALAEAGGAALGGTIGAGMGIAGGLAGTGMDMSAKAAGYSTNFSGKMANLGQNIGSAAGKMVGGFGKVGIGAGGLIASGGEDGAGVMASGISSIGNSAAQAGRAVGGMTSNIGHKTASAPYSQQASNHARQLDDSINKEFGHQARDVSLSNGEQGLNASYTGPDVLKGLADLQTTPIDNKSASIRAQWDTGMSNAEIRDTYKANNLGNKSYESLKSADHVFAKMANDIQMYNDMQKNSSAYSEREQNKIAANYAAAQNFAGVSNLRFGDSGSKVVGSGKDATTVKTRTIVGGGEAEI